MHIHKSPLFDLGFFKSSCIANFSEKKKKLMLITAATEYSKSSSHPYVLLIEISRDKEKRAKYDEKRRLKQK